MSMRDRCQRVPTCGVASRALPCRRWAKLRHDFAREQTQAFKDLRLWNGLDRVQQEVDAVDANRFPALDRLYDAPRVTDGDALGNASRIARAAGVTARPRR